MKKYKNMSATDLFVPQVGLVKAGEEVETEVEINNSNFQKVGPTKPAQATEKVEDKNKE
jgi:hypothetical protein